MNQSDSDTLISASLSRLQENLIFYWCVVVLSTGFLLNVIIMGVFINKKFINNSMAIYNRIIAFVGNLTIILLYLSIYPQFYAKYSTEFTCKLVSLFIRIYSQFTSWLHVMMSMDRMVSVLSPAIHLFIKTPLFVRLSTIVACICLLGVNMGTFWINNSRQSNLTCKGDYVSNEAHDMASIIMQCLLPIMLILVANSVLIVSIFKQKRNLRMDRSMRKEISFSVSVFVQNLLFIVFMAPEAVAMIYQKYSGYTTATSIRLGGIISLAITCANLLSTYTICCSFLINLAFNKIFRDELHIIMRSMLAMVSSKNESQSKHKKRSAPCQ